MGGTIFILLAIILLNKAEASFRVDPLINTKVGLIKGLKASDGDYSAFIGIPYGKVNDTNPFGPSSAYPPFNETFEAFDGSAICPQSTGGSLDCLHLNIYIPSSANSGNHLPVLFWIHGGRFVSESGERNVYGPKYLVRHGIILVTLNYRLGPYGFMCLGTPEVPGNQGLKDQLLALRWVNNNIESFGGDVNKITLFGASAGAMSVDAHLLSQSGKLFNNIILQSGTMLIPSIPREVNTTVPVTIANLLGFNVNDTKEAVSLLSTLDTSQVIAASSQMDFEIFLPCVENNLENIEAFLTDYPINLKIPKARNMSILIGFDAEETLFMYVNQNDEFFQTWNRINELLNLTLNFEEKHLTAMEEIIRHFYIGDEEFSKDIMEKFVEFETDFQFAYPTKRSVDRYIDNHAGNVYYYLFSYVGDRNWLRWRYNITTGNAVHGDELGYLFDISVWDGIKPSTSDQLLIDRMTTMWTNFAKYGDPTPKTWELLPIKWEPVTDKNLHNYLNIDAELTMKKRPFHDRFAFWDMFYKLNEKFQKGFKKST